MNFDSSSRRSRKEKEQIERDEKIARELEKEYKMADESTIGQSLQDAEEKFDSMFN